MNLPFDNPFFLIPLSSGIIFMLAGFLMLKFPPKKINGLYGYRTSSSMKNQERWDFSQKYSSIEMIKLGALLTLSSIFGLIFKPDGKIGMFLGLTLMILMVVFLLLQLKEQLRINLRTNNNDTTTMAISNCSFSPTSENPRGFSVWCVLVKLSANSRNYS